MRSRHSDRRSTRTSGSTSRSDSALIAITGVTVIDGKGTPAVPGQTVVIRDGRIAEVGAAAKVKAPAGAQVVDGAGMTLIPGIVGLHDHMYYSAAGGVSTQMSFTGPRLYLASGVTSVRTTGSVSPYADINLKKSIDAGETPGPRIHVTSPYLTGGAGGGEMFATDEPAAAQGVRHLLGRTRVPPGSSSTPTFPGPR